MEQSRSGDSQNGLQSSNNKKSLSATSCCPSPQTAIRQLDFDDNDSNCSTSTGNASNLSFAFLSLRKDRKPQSDSFAQTFGRPNSLLNLEKYARLPSTAKETENPGDKSNHLGTLQKQFDKLFIRSQSSKIPDVVNTLPEKDVSTNQEKMAKALHDNLTVIKPFDHKTSDVNASIITKEVLSKLAKEDMKKGENDTFSCPKDKFSHNIKYPDINIASAQNVVSVQSIANLLHNAPLATYILVDCRFEYEYNAGHIKGALNITNPELFEKIFFTNMNLLYNPKYVEDLKNNMRETLEKLESYQSVATVEPDSKLPTIIFHCEFSQKRGPRAFRALRNKDRENNKDNYPHLDYPELYILDGGFSSFYYQFKEFCEGIYVKMFDKNFAKDYAQAQELDKILWNKKSLVDLTTEIIDDEPDQE